MGNLSRKERILVGVVLFIAIICVYYLFVIKPINNKIDVENQIIVGYNSQITALNTLASDLDSLKSRVSAMSLQLPSVEKNPQLVFDIAGYSSSFASGSCI